MNLYLIRHGESVWNKDGRVQGHSDPGLSALGKRQARLLCARFDRIKIGRIYSSPLLRALETAWPLAAGLGLKIITKEGLKEVRLGAWEGKTPDEIDRACNNSYKKWLNSGPTKVKIPGAERISSFRHRIRRALRDIVAENQGRDVIVVTHGGVIAAFLAHILKADFDRIVLGLHLPNTCVTTLSFHGKRSWLVHIADTFHLADEVSGLWPGQIKKQT